jgi:hypothetical protein
MLQTDCFVFGPVFVMPLIETNPPRRGGPRCPPASIDTVLPSLDAYAALAGWMHRVRAELAGCYETSNCWMLLLRWFVA